MALIKTPEEIRILREGGKILSQVLSGVASMAKPGVSTMELERCALKLIAEKGAEPAFKGYRSHGDTVPYPAALCTSINEEVVHCIPKEDRVLRDGDIVGLDLGIKYKNLFTDSAVSVPVGKVGKEAMLLLYKTREALMAGIEQAREENTIGDISHAIEKIAKDSGLGVIRDLVGHGVGHAVHEPPDVPNFGRKGSMDKLQAGMVIAIEPMFTLGDWRVAFLDDGWSIVTADRSLAAHFEHTVAITKNDPIVLTE